MWTCIVLYDAGKILFNATVFAHVIDFFRFSTTRVTHLPGSAVNSHSVFMYDDY